MQELNIIFFVTGAADLGYYSNLMVNGVEQSQYLTSYSDPSPRIGLSPASDPTNQHGHASAKSSQGRSKNFRDEEDILLVSAWLNVGMDPIRGADQSQTSYWARIYDYFHANKSFESDRTQGSLMNRWSTIQHDVNTFCGCVTRIEDRNQSGCSVDDKVNIFLANK